jgi:hypothetical protein
MNVNRSKDVLKGVIDSVPETTRLWAASLYPERRPAEMTEVVFNEALRTPPVVTYEVQKSRSIRIGEVPGTKEFFLIK